MRDGSVTHFSFCGFLEGKVSLLSRYTMKLSFIEAGEIVTTHGVRGEVKVLCWLDSPELLC